MQKAIENRFIHTFSSKDGYKFGFRYGEKTDAKDLIEIFEDVYDYDYLYPYVYDIDEFKKRIRDRSQIWFIVEHLANGKVVATGMVKRLNEISIYAAKVLSKKEYQGKGIMSVLGTRSVLYTLSRPKLRNILRLETDVRAYSKGSQKFADKLNCICYGFIPNYNNYADKREFDIGQGESYNKGRIEPVLMYFSPIKTFWRLRERNIILYDHENISKFYKTMRKNTRRLKHDNVNYQSGKTLSCNDFSIKEDPYKSHILIRGCLKVKTLEHLLEKYDNWNVIEWRVPTTMKGINSQKIALQKEFKVMGYDPGSNYKITHTEDAILFCTFPNGIDVAQFQGMDIYEKNQPIVDLVLEAISGTN